MRPTKISANLSMAAHACNLSVSCAWNTECCFRKDEIIENSYFCTFYFWRFYLCFYSSRESDSLVFVFVFAVCVFSVERGSESETGGVCRGVNSLHVFNDVDWSISYSYDANVSTAAQQPGHECNNMAIKFPVEPQIFSRCLHVVFSSFDVGNTSLIPDYMLFVSTSTVSLWWLMNVLRYIPAVKNGWRCRVRLVQKSEGQSAGWDTRRTVKRQNHLLYLHQIIIHSSVLALIDRQVMYYRQGGQLMWEDHHNILLFFALRCLAAWHLGRAWGRWEVGYIRGMEAVCLHCEETDFAILNRQKSITRR